MRNPGFFDSARSQLRSAFAEVHQKWGWYFALGVFLIVLGLIASYVAVATTLLSVVALGWVLLAAGSGLVVLSFLTGNWSGFLLTLAAGVLSVMTGIAILNYPVSGAVGITVMVGIFLITLGIYRSVASIAMQFPNWGWSLVSGIVDVVLGAVLLKNWQSTSLWFLGLAIGIDLILHGIAWITFSLKLHSLAGVLGISEEGRRAA